MAKEKDPRLLGRAYGALSTPLKTSWLKKVAENAGAGAFNQVSGYERKLRDHMDNSHETKELLRKDDERIKNKKENMKRHLAKWDSTDKAENKKREAAKARVKNSKSAIGRAKNINEKGVNHPYEATVKKFNKETYGEEFIKNANRKIKKGERY